ncbi:uncharacterized protein LOC144317299 [Canis aureus]
MRLLALPVLRYFKDLHVKGTWYWLHQMESSGKEGKLFLLLSIPRKGSESQYFSPMLTWINHKFQRMDFSLCLSLSSCKITIEVAQDFMWCPYKDQILRKPSGHMSIGLMMPRFTGP